MISGMYPVGVEVAAGGRVARWRPLVNWLLILPPLLWLCLGWAGAGVVLVVAWFSIVCTGRMPGRLGDYLMGVLRYGWRVGAFLFGLTDCYPGFRIVAGYVDPADQPAVFYSAQPLDRRRMTVLCRLVLIVPALVFVVPVAMVLVGLLLVAWWILLVLGRWPEVLRRDVAGCFRYLLRFAGYAWLIVDVFPPVNPDPDPLTAEDGPTFASIRPDPREATGPPWPRLVGAETYQPPGLLRWPIVFGALCGLLPVSAVLATASSGPPAMIRQLGAQVLPAPAGYTSTDYYYADLGEYPNGPISRDAFDQDKGIPGAAAKLGFVGGYEAYNSSHTTGVNDEGASSLEIQLLRFSSPEYAESYEMTVSAHPGKFAKSSAFSAILGAIVIAGDPTGFRDSSCCEHEVLATKGPVVMLVHYIAAGAGGTPPILAAWAEQQYARL